MIEFFLKGGPIMWPILGCSIATVAIFFDRLWFLRRTNLIPNALFDQLCQFGKEKKYSELRVLSASSESAIARIIYSVGNLLSAESAPIKERMQHSGKLECLKLEKYLKVLSALAGAAPLLGLLGTVTGMLEVFSRIEITGTSNIKIISGGVYEALITTVAGLVVGIPSFLCSQYLESRVDRSVGELEEASLKFLDSLGDQKERGSSPS
jgi:biopolymer transport protein ExbB